MVLRRAVKTLSTDPPRRALHTTTTQERTCPGVRPTLVSSARSLLPLLVSQRVTLPAVRSERITITYFTTTWYTTINTASYESVTTCTVHIHRRGSLNNQRLQKSGSSPRAQAQLAQSQADSQQSRQSAPHTYAIFKSPLRGMGTFHIHPRVSGLAFYHI